MEVFDSPRTIHVTSGKVHTPTPAENSQPARPVGEEDRLHLLDVFRGFAILGILTVNVADMKAPASYKEFLFETYSPAGAWNETARLAIEFFCAGKFVTILSLLFGFGFGMLLEKAGQAHQPSLLPRRLLFLLGLGVIHSFLLWYGDILFHYGLAGFLLLLIHRCKPGALFAIGGILFAVGCALTVVALVLAVAVVEAVGGPGSMDQWAREAIATAREAYGHGAFGEIVRQRAHDILLFQGLLLFWIPATAGCFAFGLGAWKARLHERIAQSESGALWILLGALPLGAIGGAFLIAEQSGFFDEHLLFWLLAAPFTFLSTLATALVYLCAITLLWKRRIGQIVLRPLVPVGRMALSNYLLQSLLAALLFHSYGAGLYGRLSVLEGLAFVAVVWVFQILLSGIWLKWRDAGPLEWILRKWTYGGTARAAVRSHSIPPPLPLR